MLISTFGAATRLYYTISILMARKQLKIFPIVLAAGKSWQPQSPRALVKTRGRTALEIAVSNCAGLERPIVVLGHLAGTVKRFLPPGVRMVIHRNWRAGQISSFRAGLGRVPANGAFLIYPVDLTDLTPTILKRLATAFRRRSAHQQVVMPVHRGRDGHPVILAAELRREFTRAKTARDVVYRDPFRIKRVRTTTSAIWKDFDRRSGSGLPPRRS